MRGVALDDAIGRESFPAMLLRLWRGDAVTDDEAELLGACLVASIDHGPLSPSALVTRTIASTRAAPMSGLAGGILAFGELHGAVVSRAMRILATAPAEGDLDAWADGVFEQERAAGRRLPGIGHRWHHHDLRAERLLEVAAAASDGRHEAAVRALAARVSQHTGHPRPGQHRRRAGRGAHGAPARPGVRRLPLRHRPQLRAGRAFRRGAGS